VISNMCYAPTPPSLRPEGAVSIQIQLTGGVALKYRIVREVEASNYSASWHEYLSSGV
jgi:hypothetical protein